MATSVPARTSVSKGNNPVFMGTDLEKETQSIAWNNNEMKREQQKVAWRGAERVRIADERYNKIRAQQQANRDSQQAGLQRDIQNAEAHLWRHNLAAEKMLQDLEDNKVEVMSFEERCRSHRQEAVQKVSETRELQDQHLANTHQEIDNVKQAASDAVETLWAETRAKLDEDKQQRMDWQAETQARLVAREADANRFADEVAMFSTKEVLKMETFRHRAAASADRVQELAQATRTEAQNHMRIHSERAKEQAKELRQITHQVKLRCDTALADKMAETAAEFHSARDFCQQAALQFKQLKDENRRKVAEAEAAAGEETQTAARQVRNLELAMLDRWTEARSSIKEAGDSKNKSSEQYEQEIKALEIRFQELQEETQNRVKEIMKQWADGSKENGDAIERLAKQGREAMEELKQANGRISKITSGKHMDMQASTAAQAQLVQKQAQQDIEAIRREADEKKDEDDKATQIALAELNRLKQEAADAEAAADAEIEGAMARATLCETEMKQQAEAEAKMFKDRTKAAHAEEKLFITDTAAAYSRLRKACYQLRLANQHDLAQAIVGGEFDRPDLLYGGS
eukprot:TRINITY_DN11299_c0_g1_i1.p1 TRINITY_DN11299_c0_g1~~TRINITY_DN11299_c0_g1_i1.p1  ORF type:complete len:596 (+),score=172.14 TRINITY_DN11299_c0_g1_i1:67-1788(+)